MNSWLSTKKREDWALVAILGIAFLFRFLYLGIKPPHFDEGINGWFVDQMILNGYYSYDPTNYHGPFHFYVLWVFKFLFGRNLWALRLSASAFGLAGVYLIARLKTYLGTFTAYGAAFLLAVSPGMTFYSRYGIHETELFFFSLVALHGFFRFRALRDKISVWLIGLGITGMVITKETFIVHLICFGLACLCLWLYEKVVPSKNSTAPLIKASKGKRKAPQAAQVTADFEKLPTPFSSNDILVVASVSILIFYLFYSGFFLHFQGVVDFFRSFAAWNDTAHKGNGHDKPFFYWLQLFWTYELAALLGLALTPFFLFPAPREIRLLAIYGVGVFLAYSLTPYKTPWCILNIVWPFYFVVAYFVRPRASQSYLSVAAVVILAGPATFQSVKVNFYKYDDESEPYVYVQTFSDIMKITEKIMHLVNKDPSKYHMPIKLFMDSNWPLPWILGDFTRAYYYGAPRDVDPNGDLIICDQKYSLLVENQITKKYFKVDFRLRSAQEPAVAYFDAEIFKDQFPVDAPTVSPKPTEPLAPGQGLLAEYYSNAQWTGNPVIKKIVSQPEFNLQDPQRPLPAPFGIIYSGEIFFPTSGNQMFYLDSDDGSDLHIDGKLVVENLGPHAEQMRTGTMTFTKGWHPIKIRYNDFGGGMVLRLWWNNTSGFQQGIEPRFFRLTKENIKGGGTH